VQAHPCRSSRSALPGAPSSHRQWPAASDRRRFPGAVSMAAPMISPAPELVPEPVCEPVQAEVVPEPPHPSPSPSRVTPLAPQRYAFQTTIGQSTHGKLQAIQELLGARVHPRDLEQILDLAFDALLGELERSKHGSTDHPRRAKPSR